MAASIFTLQLANSEGLSKIIYFHGLEHVVVIHPTIHGEPILTAQAFYYLEKLESVASLRFEYGIKVPSTQEMEYLVDNYLYQYSKIDSNSKICTKVTEGKFLRRDPSEYHLPYDQGCTRALVLDQFNDKSICHLAPTDPNDSVDFLDWCLVKNYSDDIFSSYLNSMAKLLDKKVNAMVMPTEYRDGYIGRLRLLELDFGLLDFFQADQLENIDASRITPGTASFPIKSHYSDATTTEIPVKTIHLTIKYNPTLLSYYFSGLKEHNPLLSFIGFFNVIEHYFEEAPILLGKTAKIELDQIKCVVELLTDNKGIVDFINNLDSSTRNKLSASIPTSSGVNIPGFSPASITEHISELGRWLYDLRCAVVHSKKTRKGRPTATFEPYSQAAENIHVALPLIKWLSILCIEKDFQLNHPSTS